MPVIFGVNAIQAKHGDGTFQTSFLLNDSMIEKASYYPSGTHKPIVKAKSWKYYPSLSHIGLKYFCKPSSKSQIFNDTLTFSLALLVHVIRREVIDFALDCCDTENLAE